jgi:hypothetical protein
LEFRNIEDQGPDRGERQDLTANDRDSPKKSGVSPLQRAALAAAPMEESLRSLSFVTEGRPAMDRQVFEASLSTSLGL